MKAFGRDVSELVGLNLVNKHTGYPHKVVGLWERVGVLIEPGTVHDGWTPAELENHYHNPFNMEFNNTSENMPTPNNPERNEQ